MNAKTIEERYTEEWAKGFTNSLKEWQTANAPEGKKKANQEDFFWKVQEVLGKESGNPTSVSDWRNAKYLPEKETREAIYKVLGVEEEAFFREGHKYRYNEDVVSRIIEDKRLLSADIGLDASFIEWVKCLSFFENEFPLFEDKRVLSEGVNHPCWGYAESGSYLPMSGNLGVFQYNKDDKTITFSRPDLFFLKDVQDKVAELVELLFMKRQKEKDVSLKEWEDKFPIIVDNNRVQFDTAPTLEDYISSDKYYKYNVKVNGKYIYSPNKEEGENNGKY